MATPGLTGAGGSRRRRSTGWRAEGVLFANCFTNNPKCSPCRASILTGRNTWQLEEAMCHNGIFPAKWPVYPDLLEQAGYLVGFTGKGWGPGDFQAGGFKRNPAGPAYQQYTQQAAAPRGSAAPITPAISPTSSRNASPASRFASGSAATSRTAPTRTGSAGDRARIPAA